MDFMSRRIKHVNQPWPKNLPEKSDSSPRPKNFIWNSFTFN